MCLQLVDDETTQRLEKSFKKLLSKNGSYAWKILSFNFSTKKWETPYFGDDIDWGKEQVSTRETKELSQEEKSSKQVNLGFHVFCTKASATKELEIMEQYVTRKLLLVKVKVNTDDLVAVGYFALGKSNYKSAVFTKIKYVREEA